MKLSLCVRGMIKNLLEDAEAVEARLRVPRPHNLDFYQDRLLVSLDRVISSGRRILEREDNK